MTSDLGSAAEKVYANSGNLEVLSKVPEDAKKILDIGCGAGDNARQLMREDRTIIGLTLSEDEAKIAGEFCDRVIVANVEQGLPEPMSGVDVAICSHILEHICFPEKLLAGVRQSLSPNGRLIVALPNLMWYRTRFRILMGRFEYEPHGIMDNTHFRWYTFKSAQRMLEQNGYVVESAHAKGDLPLGPIRRLLPKSWFVFPDKLACRVFPGLFGFQMVFCVRASSDAESQSA